MADFGTADGEQLRRLPDDADAGLISALRMGDESAFTTLVDRYHASMVRIARLYVTDQAQAEEVAQEAWLGVLRGIERFEGRSSLRTWLYRILTNIAKTRSRREARTIPFSSLWSPDDDPGEAAVEPEHFLPPDHAQWPGHWQTPPQSWGAVPEAQLLSQETRERIQVAIAALPATQREVITLRDVEGWSAEEVCNALSLTETNQRVLLHRARSKVRQALGAYLVEE